MQICLYIRGNFILVQKFMLKLSFPFWADGVEADTVQ